MSWYYDYYICRKSKDDGKIYPFGPFDYNGNFFPALSRSRSFASDLYEYFRDIRTSNERKMISEELIKNIYKELSESDYEEFYGGSGHYFWSYLSYEELPKGDYIKKGYCLIDDIECYEDTDSYFEGFYDWLTPEIYTRKLENEMKFGPPLPVKDEFGNDYTPHSMRDYSFYIWEDDKSQEYEAYTIRSVFNTIKTLDNEDDIYVVLVQG